jgi:hypothetical protein
MTQALALLALLAAPGGKLLFQDDFAGPLAGKDWQVIVGGWQTKDGLLEGTEQEKDHHRAGLAHLVPAERLAVQFDFRFEGATAVALIFNHQGTDHLANVQFSMKAGQLTLTNMSGWGKTTKSTPLAKVPMTFTAGRWYKALVTVNDRKIEVTLDGKPVAKGMLDDQSAHPKNSFVFGVWGQHAAFDNVRVSEL